MEVSTTLDSTNIDLTFVHNIAADLLSYVCYFSYTSTSLEDV